MKFLAAHLFTRSGRRPEASTQRHPANHCHAVPKYCATCGWWTTNCGH